MVEVKDVSEGREGRVFRVQCEDGLWCIKLVPATSEPPFAAEPIDDRVYGPRQSNLLPARRVLREAGIALPALRRHGVLPGAPPLAFQVMEFLDGVSLRAWLQRPKAPGAAALHALAGRLLGRMHREPRAYAGWPALPPQEAWSWHEAFFASFENRLTRAADRSERVAALRPLAAALLERAARDWRPARSFVFSHPDGLQGIVQRQGDDWSFAGAVDVEDHTFSDPRFALAGYDLAHPITDAFAQAYRAETDWPSDYETARPLCQLYFLLTWVAVFHDEGGALLRHLPAVERQISERVR